MHPLCYWTHVYNVPGYAIDGLYCRCTIAIVHNNVQCNISCRCTYILVMVCWFHVMFLDVYVVLCTTFVFVMLIRLLINIWNLWINIMIYIFWYFIFVSHIYVTVNTRYTITSINASTTYHKRNKHTHTHVYIVVFHQQLKKEEKNTYIKNVYLF